MFIRLSLFRITDSSRRECACNASACAGNILKAACNTFGFRLAGIFQNKLASEAQNLSTASITYHDLESISRCPTIDSQPIVAGFSLPPYYFSCTASTKFVVNVFCQLVSFVHDNRAWRQYIDWATLVGDAYATLDGFLLYSLNSYAKTFRELERSWTGDQAINRDTLRSLGTSTCAGLVMVSPCHAIQIHKIDYMRQRIKWRKLLASALQMLNC